MISCYGSAKKAKDGNILRHVSTVGHASKVVTKLAKVDCVAGHVAKAGLDTLDAAAKTSKGLQAAGKLIKLSRYTDPISCACALIRVGKSDIPGRSFIEEASALCGMFVVEGAMIKHAKSIANIKGIKQLNDGLVKFSKNTKGCGQLPALAYGVLFTIGSAIGTKLAGKAGKWIADKLQLPESQQKKEQEALKAQKEAQKPKKQYYWG